MQVIEEQNKEVGNRADELADFIMFTQRSFLLDLSNELNDGNVSYAQFFLLGYLSKEEFLTMTDISKKMGHSTAAATGLVDRLEKLGYRSVISIVISDRSGRGPTTLMSPVVTFHHCGNSSM